MSSHVPVKPVAKGLLPCLKSGSLSSNPAFGYKTGEIKKKTWRKKKKTLAFKKNLLVTNCVSSCFYPPHLSSFLPSASIVRQIFSLLLPVQVPTINTLELCAC
jgi:hypothetical protein